MPFCFQLFQIASKKISCASITHKWDGIYRKRNSFVGNNHALTNPITFFLLWMEQLSWIILKRLGSIFMRNDEKLLFCIRWDSFLGQRRWNSLMMLEVLSNFPHMRRIALFMILWVIFIMRKVMRSIIIIITFSSKME